MHIASGPKNNLSVKHLPHKNGLAPGPMAHIFGCPVYTFLVFAATAAHVVQYFLTLPRGVAGRNKIVGVSAAEKPRCALTSIFMIAAEAAALPLV